jgi:tetratricopeptide (TPR) repeat protein
MFASLVCLGLLLVALPVRLAFGQSLASSALGQARANHDSTPHDRNTPRDAAQAWKWMQSSLKSAGVSKPVLQDGVVTGEINGKTPFAIRLALVNSVTAPDMTAIPFGQMYSVHWYEFPNLSSSPGTLIWSGHWAPAIEMHDAQRFQAALVYLVRTTQDDQDAKLNAWLEGFKPKAAAWRQMKMKPPMPEEAHEHQVLAEYAYKQKDIPKAMSEYAAALQIFPFWPDGQYDLATMTSEIGGRPGYRNAIFHMECFLALNPDSRDAEAASDSIIVWKDKMKNGGRHSSSGSLDQSGGGLN